MNAPSNLKEAKELINKLAMELGEHFESVRIFVTIPSSDGSHNSAGIDSGIGNYYAQVGHVREWMLIQDEYCRLEAKRMSEMGEE